MGGSNLKEYSATVMFDLGGSEMSIDNIDDLLFEAGFDDALISHSCTGQIEIEVLRNAETIDFLKESIIQKIRSLFPNSKCLN